MNNRTLFIVLAALLGIYGLTRLFSGQRQATFDPNLAPIDTSAVTRLNIQPAGEATAFTLQRQEGGWAGKEDGRTVTLSPDAVSRALAALEQIRAQRVVAKSEAQWKDYGLSGEEARQFEVFAGEEKVANLYLGKLDFDQQTRSATAYVRTGDAPDVYAVDGFQTMNLPAGLTSLRDKTALKMKAGMEVTAVDYQQGSTAHRLERTPEGWLLQGHLLDSAKVENYLNTLRNLNATAFADGFEPAGQPPLKTLTLSGNNMAAPFRVEAYADTLGASPFVIHSSYRPDVFFRSDSSGLHQNVFGKLETLIKENGS